MTSTELIALLRRDAQLQVAPGNAKINHSLSWILRFLASSIALTTTIGATLLGAQSRLPVAGIYSDLRYNTQGGDLLGMEVFVVVGPGGYFATVQCAGGTPAKPEVVPVAYANGSINFTLTVPQPECGLHFQATLTRTGLRGRFDGESEDRWLPRRKSYWQ